MILDSIDNCYNITKCLIARGYYLRAGMFKHSLVLLRALLECGYYLRECLIWGNTVFKGLHCVTFIKCPIHWIWISYLNFKAVLVLPKMAGSAQTHKSISFIWICLEHSIFISLGLAVNSKGFPYNKLIIQICHIIYCPSL